MATRIGLEPTTPSVTGWCSNQLSYRAILEQRLLLHYGAADEARTRYLHLGKVALYQMSYARKWCPEPESNQRHGDFQSPALPTELQRRMATRKGLEPSTSGVTGRRSNQLNYRAIFLSKDSGRCNLSWQGQKDSNPRHSVLETDALPAELYP